MRASRCTQFHTVAGLSLLLACSGGSEQTMGGQAGAGGGEAGAGGRPSASGGHAGSVTPTTLGGSGGAAAGAPGGAPGMAGAAGDAAGSGGTNAPMAGAGGQAGGAAGGPAAILGSGDHTTATVKVTKLATVAGCLVEPWDLAFNPLRPTELWIINHADDSVCLVRDATTAPKSERRQESLHEHFMARPAGLAFGGDKTSFGVPGTFATANDSAGDSNPTDGQLWNGIVLWPSDLASFGVYKGGPEGNSHLDMLHDSPLARGIAWEKDNIYWVFGSFLGDITRYDFAQDHNRGFTDHTDGMQWHYAAGQVKGSDGIPSHLAYDASDGTLYIADTGNHRVAKLDTKSGTMSPTRHTRAKDRIETKLDAVMTGTNAVDFVPAGGELTSPAGIEVAMGTVFVTDHATGFIHAFDRTGRKANWLDTGLGAGTITGVTVGPDKRVYFTAAKTSAVYVVGP